MAFILAGLFELGEIIAGAVLGSAAAAEASATVGTVLLAGAETAEIIGAAAEIGTLSAGIGAIGEVGATIGGAVGTITGVGESLGGLGEALVGLGTLEATGAAAETAVLAGEGATILEGTVIGTLGETGAEIAVNVAGDFGFAETSAVIVPEFVLAEEEVVSTTASQIFDTVYELSKAATEISVATTATVITIEKLIDAFNGETGKKVPPGDILTNPDGTATNPYQIGYDVGKLLALSEQYISAIMTDGNKENLDENELEARALKYVMERHPDLLYLLEAVWSIEKEKMPDIRTLLEEVKQYTGDIDMNSVFKEYSEKAGRYVYGFINELGEREVYDGPYGTLPAIYGTFVGPSSFNKTPPKPGSLLDLFALSHDQGYYLNGYFSFRDDLILINRCKNQLGKMKTIEKQVAKMAINYFGTIGSTIALMKRGLPSDVERAPTSMNSNDIFAVITGQQNKPEARATFYRGMKYGLIDWNGLTKFAGESQEIVPGGYTIPDPPVQPIGNSFLQAFDNMSVVSVSA